MDEELAKARSLEGAVIVDVRQPSEYASGHVRGAVNIPVGELESRLGELPDKDAPLFLYCASGARSARATALLKSHGYTDLTDMGSIRRCSEQLER